MAGDWIAVHAGPMWETIALQTHLEAEGIESFVPDLNTKTIDPFITGAGAFQFTLLVPPDAVEAAREVLSRGRPPVPVPDAPAPDVVAAANEIETRRIEKLGLRMRWASICVVTAPWALILAGDYLRSTRALGWRPDGHVYNLGAMILGSAAFIGALASFGPALMGAFTRP